MKPLLEPVVHGEGNAPGVRDVAPARSNTGQENSTPAHDTDAVISPLRRLLPSSGESATPPPCARPTEACESAAPSKSPGARDLIGDLISTVERVEQRLAHGDSSTLPRRFPWAPDDEIEALENQMDAMSGRYR
ncbi:MAG TPA: hypothetical protein VNW97_16735 [Candidatus Saccharimonadales bacterium]|nr:hypothetical protein [Candidatus Saccharimonadales bacterium]